VIITEVNRQRITDQTSFEKAVNQIKPGQILLLRAMRQPITSQPYFIAAFRVGLATTESKSLAN
jgi:S1-C subfamily serine protease